MNYRSHEHTSFDLDPITVFIGPVASGKSNLFRGLVLLQNAMFRTPTELFGSGPWDFWAQRYRGVTSQTAAIGFRVVLDQLDGFEGEKATYALELSQAPSGVFIAHEQLDGLRLPASGQSDQTVFLRRMRGGSYGEFGHFNDEDGTILGASRQRVRDGYKPENVCFAAAAADQLARYGYYHVEASELRRTSPAQDRPRRLGYGGRDLAGALALLRDTPQGAPLLDLITTELRAVLPDLQELRLVSVGPDQLGVAFRHAAYDSHITAAEASDGTLYTLGLLAIVYQTDPPAVLAIGEPETGLHPARLRWLVDKLVDLAYGRIGAHPVQVLLSTHSPYLLDFFRDMPAAVRVVRLRDGKTTVSALLDALRERGVSREEMLAAPLGEQWYSGVFEE